MVRRLEHGDVLSGTGSDGCEFPSTLKTAGTFDAYFAVDVLSATTGNTGPVGAVNPPTQTAVPEPTSVVLLGSVAALLVRATRVVQD